MDLLLQRDKERKNGTTGLVEKMLAADKFRIVIFSSFYLQQGFLSAKFTCDFTRTKFFLDEKIYTPVFLRVACCPVECAGSTLCFV
jgi:hypothetical protein